MDGGLCELTISEYKIESRNDNILKHSDHPEYIEYVNLLKEYFEIKNDNQRLKEKFVEITTKYQHLVRMGIIKQ